jgi:hypothetical protein
MWAPSYAATGTTSTLRNGCGRPCGTQLSCDNCYGNLVHLGEVPDPVLVRLKSSVKYGAALPAYEPSLPEVRIPAVLAVVLPRVVPRLGSRPWTGKNFRRRA